MSGFVLSDDFTVPVVEVVYRPHIALSKRPGISSLQSAGRIFFETWEKESISTEEKVRIMLLSQAYEVLGIYEMTANIDAIMENPKNIILAALRTDACAICIAHNSCSGDLKPGKVDEKLLHKAIQIGNIFRIDIWDYVIVGKNGFFSCRQQKILTYPLIHDKQHSQTKHTKVDFLKGEVREIDIRNIAKNIQSDDGQGVKDVSYSAANEFTFTKHLHQLINTLQTLPSLLKGPVRRLKIMSARRGYPVLNNQWRQVYKDTSRIYLMGDWIEKTGLSCQERIKVIPMHRLLIIVPEEKNNNDE